jgi:hypothetical protein
LESVLLLEYGPLQLGALVAASDGVEVVLGLLIVTLCDFVVFNFIQNASSDSAAAVSLLIFVVELDFSVFTEFLIVVSDFFFQLLVFLSEVMNLSTQPLDLRLLILVSGVGFIFKV